MMTEQRPIKVLGEIAPSEAVDAALTRMRTLSFRTTELVALVERNWPDGGHERCRRLADRLIQAERKAARIELVKGRRCWRWIGG